MRKTLKASLLVSDAGGFVGKGLVGTTAVGEIYVDGDDPNFLSPAGKGFVLSGKVTGVQGQAAMDILQKYGLLDKVVGVAMGGIRVTVAPDMTLHGSVDSDKCTVDWSAVVTGGFSTLDNIVVNVGVKGVFNSMVIDNVVITGQGAQAT